jgi:phage terminase large subunit-like protein
MRTAVAKRPGSRLVTISTAGPSADTPLGRLRARALAQGDVTTKGALTVAKGRRLAMLEWRCPEDADVADMAVVKKANPASWITKDALAGQHEAVPEIAFRRFHCNQWAGAEAGWLPPGAWQACVGEPAFTDGERIWIGVDLGGEWSDSAVVWLNEAGHVGCYIGSGEEAIMEVAELIEDLAGQYRIAEVTFDPWRSGILAQQLEQRRVRVSHFPMTDTRTIPASARLHQAIVDGDLVLPDDPRLREHASGAIAKQSRRGWRIDKPGRSQHSGNIDGVVALMMALDIKESRPEPVRVLGYI